MTRSAISKSPKNSGDIEIALTDGRDKIAAAVGALAHNGHDAEQAPAGIPHLRTDRLVPRQTFELNVDGFNQRRAEVETCDGKRRRRHGRSRSERARRGLAR